jgi:hypothetical protein
MWRRLILHWVAHQSHVGNHLLLRVSYDGIGFDVKAASTPLDDHYGILEMHE